MRSRLSFLICLTAAAMLLAACSSTTVVARDDRATTSVGEADSDQSTDDSANDAEAEPTDDADVDSDTDTDDGDSDTADDDRGSRDGTAEAQELDAEGFGLGGAEQLDSLLIDCQDGNDLACDILFQISAFDSREELTAVTCGGRSDVTVSFCTAGIDVGADQLVFDPDSEGLDRVVEACEDEANMTACDFLYYRSPIDSEFQEIGGTCGGRVSVAVPDCRSSFDE